MRDDTIADSTDIKFACSQCGQRMIVAKSGAGEKVNCPVCEHPLTVPYVSEFTGDDDESVTTATKASQEQVEYQGPNPVHTASGRAVAQDGSLERELASIKQELARQQALFKKAVDECERQTASATHAHAELKSFQSDRQQLKTDLAHLRQRALSAEAQVAELTAALASTQAEDTNLRQQLENDLAIARELQAATETQLTVREGELREAAAKGAAFEQELAKAQADLAGVQASEAGLRHDLEAACREASDNAQLFALADQEQHAAHARAHAAAEENQQLLKERDELREQAQRLRSDLSETESGREMIELRERVQRLDSEHEGLTANLATLSSQNQSLAATVQSLQAELDETRCLQQEAERRAEVNSGARLNKDNEVLRGIVARQNATLDAQHSELRRLRRARFILHTFYTIFGIGLLALIFMALQIFYPQAFEALLPR